MNIIGINVSHNASACLMSEGKIVIAVQEERFTRIKHDDSFPIESIKFILESNKLSLKYI